MQRGNLYFVLVASPFVSETLDVSEQLHFVFQWNGSRVIVIFIENFTVSEKNAQPTCDRLEKWSLKLFMQLIHQ